MKKVEEAKAILKALGLPKKQQNTRSALTLLALCNLKKNDKWKDAQQISMAVMGGKKNSRYEGIMRFIAENYNQHYAENTRESIRRGTLHQFIQAGLVSYNPEDPSLPTNSKDIHYSLTKEALEVIRTYGTNQWEEKLSQFKENMGFLSEKYAKERTLRKIPVRLSDGTELQFSPGKHNEVQAAIIEKFAPRFTYGGELLYVGDTAQKDLYVDSPSLQELGIPIDGHTKLPDVIIYEPKRDWLFLIEAVTSHGPVSPKRLIELEAFLKNCISGKIYVTAFPDFNEFKRHTNDIAWETEVWLMDFPEHMIHFNGDKFMGPR
jgi:type II restriction enzyme